MEIIPLMFNVIRFPMLYVLSLPCPSLGSRYSLRNLTVDQEKALPTFNSRQPGVISMGIHEHSRSQSGSDVGDGSESV